MENSGCGKGGGAAIPYPEEILSEVLSKVDWELEIFSGDFLTQLVNIAATNPPVAKPPNVNICLLICLLVLVIKSNITYQTSFFHRVQAQLKIKTARGLNVRWVRA